MDQGSKRRKGVGFRLIDFAFPFLLYSLGFPLYLLASKNILLQ